jgi:hypothetical protein
MALVNRLIKEARQKPECVWINANQVGTIVEHFLAATWRHDITREQLAGTIRTGGLKLLGVPVRVRGTRTQ